MGTGYVRNDTAYLNCGYDGFKGLGSFRIGSDSQVGGSIQNRRQVNQAPTYQRELS